MKSTLTENELLEVLKEKIEGLAHQKSKPFRIAINGIEGTGKTVLAKKMTQFLVQAGLNAIHVSIDGFHFNKEHRYRQGRNSAKGYYEDSYDEQSFIDKVLLASQKTPSTIALATHDLETDYYLDIEAVGIANDAILITDGAYLLKKIYQPHWDLKIYLKTDFETALTRGSARDAKQFGSVEAAKEKFKLRYHQASQMYIRDCQPEQIADIIIDYTNFNQLKVLKMP